MRGTITSKQQISWLFENGKKFSSASFLALYDKTGSCSSKRASDAESSLSPQRSHDKKGALAFIAGKKLGVAPRRSKAKRRLREAVRRAEFCPKEYNVVFVARKGAVEKDFSSLIADMRRLQAHLGSSDAPLKGDEASARASETQREQTELVPTLEGSEQPSSAGKKILKVIIGIPRTLALLCIKLYRHAISPLLPPSCRYVPTCSEYALIAFERFGFWKGLWLAVRRVGRCHPFVEGGYDPVPEVQK